MGKPSDFLGEGPLCLLGNIRGVVDLEIPDYDTKEEWDAWFEEICERHIVQSGKIRWEIAQDKDAFLKNMGYVDDEEEDDMDAETPYEQYIFEL